MSGAFSLVVRNPRQYLAAGAGSAVGTLVDVLGLVLLVELGVPVGMAAFVGAVLGAVVNFALGKYVVFRDRSPIRGEQLARFGLVAVATAALLSVAMHVAVIELGAPYLFAKLACAAIVFAAWTYPAQRRLVFARAASAV